MVTEIASIVSVSVSTVTLIIAYRTFGRMRTFENENIIFKHNIEKYNEVLSYMANSLCIFSKEIEECYDYLLSGEVDDDHVDKLKDRMFQRMEETEFILLSKAVFVAESVVDVMEKYVEMLYKANFINALYKEDYPVKQIEKNQKRDTAYLRKLEDCFFELADAMRKDSGVEPIMEKLHSRIGNGKVSRSKPS